MSWSPRSRLLSSRRANLHSLCVNVPPPPTPCFFISVHSCAFCPSTAKLLGPHVRLNRAAGNYLCIDYRSLPIDSLTCREKLFDSLKAALWRPLFPAREPAMNGAHRRRPNNRQFDGRIEKRLPTSVHVYLASLDEPRARERTLTENVSPHGARVISQRSWRSGEESVVTFLTGEFPHVGKVIYCVPKAGDRFCLGVEFSDRTVKWGEHSGA